MLTLTYSETGTRVPDKQAENWARKKIKAYQNKPAGTDVTITVANGIVVSAFRVLVKEGVMDHNDIQVLHGGLIYPINEYGRLIIWPPGFAEGEDSLLERLLF